MLRPSRSGDGYAFLAGIGAWSEGVVSQPGYQIVRATLRQLVDYRTGLDLVAQHLQKIDRPMTALCGVELRMREPLTLEGFQELNAAYFATLAERGLIIDGHNPIARTNVAISDGPAQPALHGFAYTIPSERTPTAFVVAGVAELRGNSLLPETIVRRGETTDDAIREKTLHVMKVVASRMERLGVGWNDATEVCLYTTMAAEGIVTDMLQHAIGPAVRHGITWYVSQPPFEGIDLEVDVRGVATDEFLGP